MDMLTGYGMPSGGAKIRLDGQPLFHHSLSHIMATRRFAGLLQAVREDIRRNFRPGDRYRSVRDAAERFDASAQTVHRVLGQLVADGMLEARARRGLFVLPGAVGPLARVGIVSAQADPRYNAAVRKGFIEGLGREVPLMVATMADTTGVSFGNWLLGLGWDAAFVVGFRRSALAFYHARVHGMELISNIIHDELPELPAVQLDNRKYARDAARMLAAARVKEVLGVGYWPINNVRWRVFRESMAVLVPGVKMSYAWLSEQSAVGQLHLFLERAKPGMMVLSLDFAANHVVAPFLARCGVDPATGLFVFNHDDDPPTDAFLAPVQSIAPSLRAHACELGRRLSERLDSGSWGEFPQTRC